MSAVMDEDTYRAKDIEVKRRGTYLTILGFAAAIFTVWIQYATLNSQIKREIQAREAEYSLRLWEKQAECYGDLMRQVTVLKRGNVELPIETSEFKSALSHLHDLDDGDLRMFGSKAVQQVTNQLCGIEEDLIYMTIQLNASDADKSKPLQAFTEARVELVKVCLSALQQRKLGEEISTPTSSSRSRSGRLWPPR